MAIASHPVRTWSIAVAAVFATVGLAACGGGEDDASSSTVTTSTLATTTTSTAPTSTTQAATTVPAASTYTIVAGDSLSAIADRADVTLDELIAANGWTDGAEHLILPGDVIELPEGSSIPTNPDSSVPAFGDDAAGGYGPATVDVGLTDDRTAPVVEPLADGIYYAQDVTSNGDLVTFVLGQWFACDGDGVPDQPTVDCGGGVGTLDDPSAEVGLSPAAAVTVATGDLADPTQADISVAEYVRLVSGASPAADAPAGYVFEPFPTLVEVRSGSVVAVEQFYTS